MRPTPRVGGCVYSTGGETVSRAARGRAMDEQVRWVTKEEAVDADQPAHQAID
ncbi:MAG: hypothetical protein OXF50_16070 [Caldilineaceae bacterium]|nr:hypothetical protein [Caldilineaceae bacterium]